MQLTISTEFDWGVQAFMTDETAYLVDVPTMINEKEHSRWESDDGTARAKWARPSQPQLRKYFRQIVEFPEKAKQVDSYPAILAVSAVNIAALYQTLFLSIAMPLRLLSRLSDLFVNA